jgi:RNA polymerase sigma-70 factor (ECF subfamily)
MSQELIQACLYGDPIARNQLIEQQYSPFMAMARRYAKSNAQADVFFQTAFVHVFQMLPQFKDSGLCFDAWMKETFLSSVIQQLKNNKAEYYVTTTTRVADDGKKASNDPGQEKEEDVNDLSAEEYIRALQQLPASFRTVYNMRVIDQYPFSTISQLMEVSESSAQNTLERARNQFGKNLQTYLHGHA